MAVSSAGSELGLSELSVANTAAAAAPITVGGVGSFAPGTELGTGAATVAVAVGGGSGSDAR